MNLQAKSFKLLPSIDKLLQSEELKPLIDRVGQDAVKSESRSQLDSLRTAITNNDERILKRLTEDDFLETLCVTIKGNVESEFAGSLLPVFNLTGTVLHTNLGRARLPQKAISAMQLVASEAVNLEYDLAVGTRGDRDSHIEETLCNITGAEAATIVNNNAAAVLLVLNTLAEKKEVVVSRGELVEIGGSFRIPDVMKSVYAAFHRVPSTASPYNETSDITNRGEITRLMEGLDHRRSRMAGTMGSSGTREQKDFRTEVRSWLKGNIPKEPLPSMDTQEGFELHRAWEKKVFENGWSVITWPEKYGGRDLGVFEWLIFEEEYYHSGAPGRVNRNGINLLAPALFDFGTDEQKNRFLQAMASGEETVSYTHLTLPTNREV